MSIPECKQEIFEVLRGVADSYRESPTDYRLKELAERLAKIHSPDLFRFLWSIPQAYNTFPRLDKLEQDARIACGLEKKRHGITADMIAKNSEQLRKEGASEEAIKRGEEFFRTIIGMDKPRLPKEPELEDFKIEDFDLEF